MKDNIYECEGTLTKGFAFESYWALFLNTFYFKLSGCIDSLGNIIAFLQIP